MGSCLEGFSGELRQGVQGVLEGFASVPGAVREACRIQGTAVIACQQRLPQFSITYALAEASCLFVGCGAYGSRCSVDSLWPEAWGIAAKHEIPVSHP